jgi:protoporphyrinogen oxidase
MQNDRNKIAVIIGAGPAGLTAAYELLKKAKNIKPVIYEASNYFGGIAKTVNYKGNRMDMGGHRFFSKSDRVMQWWLNILPLQAATSEKKQTVNINYQNKTKSIAVSTAGPDPEKTDKVMLIRRRLSRIFFLRKFFDYPVALNWNTISNLGLVRMFKIVFSYLKVKVLPKKEEKSLEDFFINRFGKELYLTFFKDYTEKVWGVPCVEIAPEWGAQRIKGLSISKALLHFIKQIFSSKSSIEQKNIETSLIQQFLYPKLGPGQMWEEVAKIVKEQGAKVYLNNKVVGLKLANNKITEVKIKNIITGEIKIQTGDYFFSTMPVKELIESLEPPAPAEILTLAKGLMYRDFITVGLLLKKLKIQNETNIKASYSIVPDNWIYIQEPDVKIGRLQIFNNWSPYLVKDPNTVWIGLEYFCNEGDELWNKTDLEFIRFAIDELTKIGIIEKENVLDSTIVRVKKAYPAYFGTYDKFDVIKKFTDAIENLFLIGRNGMHKYNNQDHSMLTAMVAVENIINGVKTKDNIWSVNTEQDYHESK